MKKKFLNLLFTPLLITPIIVSSCADTNNVAAQSFTYDSNKYQLYIVPVAGDDNSYTKADVLIRLKYTEDPNNKESTNQYIGDITISDSYTNKDNGYSYKTNIVSFDVSDESYNTKVKYSFDITNQDGYTYTKYVQYYIKNFIVNGNRFTTDLDEFDYNNKRYDIYVTGLTTMNVNSFNSTSSILFDKTSNIDFSDKLNKIDRFLIFCRFDLKLPNSLKIINSFDISSLSQSEFTIPSSVEEISDYAFAYLSQTLINSTSEDSKSSTEKQKIKVPTKFESRETNIFGESDSYTHKDFNIEYY